MLKAFKVFRRKRVQTASAMSGVFQRMGIYIERKQRKAADYLNAKAAQLSRRQLFIGFWIFCMLFGGYAICVFVQAFYKPAKAVQVKAIHVPQHSIIPEAKVPANQVLTTGEVNSIIQFQAYLDSLQETATGKRIYDSIAHNRPGLLDSLRMIQQLFSEQLKSSEDGKKR